MKRIIISTAFVLSFAIPNFAAMAQTQFTCVSLTRNLSIGMTGEDVKDLKYFLALNKLYNPTYGGMYNNMFDYPTKRALIFWQVTHNIIPANGIAGRTTANKIHMITCPVIVTPKSADLNGDGKVTTADLAILGNILNSKAVDNNKDDDFSHTSNSKYDLNNDGKINLADLALINNQIPANIRADVNSDGVVNTKDITFFNTFIGTSIGDQYAPADDMNADGKVDAADIPLFKAAYDLVVKPVVTPATVVGDVNNDGVIDQTDLDLVKAAINTSPGDANFNPAADINGDGHITITDVALLKLKIETKRADLDGDGKVTTADITILGNALNSTSTPSSYNPKYDLNNDGKVDLADLAELNRLVPTNMRADVNSDGVVDTKDITFFNTFIGTSIGDGYVAADDLNADGKVDTADIALYKTAYSNK